MQDRCLLRLHLQCLDFRCLLDNVHMSLATAIERACMSRYVFDSVLRASCYREHFQEGAWRAEQQAGPHSFLSLCKFGWKGLAAHVTILRTNQSGVRLQHAWLRILCIAIHLMYSFKHAMGSFCFMYDWWSRSQSVLRRALLAIDHSCSRASVLKLQKSCLQAR